MSRGGDASQWTAQQTLSYVTGMIAADDQEDEEQYKETLYTALSISYEYLINSTKRKITWSLSLEKLAYQFIELAFETNMHPSIKEVFKSYRALTQGQYSESLKYVLEHYRDKKLETILEDQISEDDLLIIRNMPNIQSDQSSSEVILSSFKPELKQKQIQLKNKLKIVWEGYKSIVETVRVNQKLEDVYMATLIKIFDFVDRYNRKHQFKTFCKTLRSGLQNAFNKRDKTEQQKAIYIDIEKTEVNNRNIEIRMDQFKTTTKLGLWQEAFQVLEDINTLMKVRKTPVRASVKCQYFQNLSILFKKSNYWHYHAFAYYNYYLAYMTKPKITAEEKRDLSDQLLLSVLCIPPSTLQSHQNKDSQQKICSMMISSTKVPDKNQLFDIMISKGVLENSSEVVKKLWNFMFLEFTLSSLNKGLLLLKDIKSQLSQFTQKIEDILIYKQLISIAEVYQKIKTSSLLKLIPLPKEKVDKILIQCHKQKIIDFNVDEHQGVIIFEDKFEQLNPYEEFHDIFIEIAIAQENQRKFDQNFIKKKAFNFVEGAEEYFWKVRQYKIQEYKKKLKKPKQELLNREKLREKQKKQQIQRLEVQRKFKQTEALKKSQELQKILAMKKIIINDIISIKEHRVVRIIDKKIQNLTDEEIQNLTVQILEQKLEETKKKITNNKQAKLRKTFTAVDYFERERRFLLDEKIQKSMLNEEEEQQIAQRIKDLSRFDFEEKKEQRNKLFKLANYIKSKVDDEIAIVNARYDAEINQFKKKLHDGFKDKILAKAKSLREENQKKKIQNLKKTEAQLEEQYAGGVWKRNTPVVKPINALKSDNQNYKQEYNPKDQAPFAFGKKNQNVFENLEGVKDQKNKEPRNQFWGRKSKEAMQLQKQKEKQEAGKEKQVYRPQVKKEEKKQSGEIWKKNVNPIASNTTNPIVSQPPKVNSFQAPPLEKPKEGRKFVDVNETKKKEEAPPQQKKKGKWG